MMRERRMVDALRRCQTAEMIEHDRARQPLQQIRGGDDLVGAQMNLHVPAERLRRASPAARSCRCVVAAVFGSNCVKRMPRTPPSAMRLSSASVTVGCTTATPRACGAKLRDGVERHRVVGEIGGRRHHDDAARPDALLQQPVVRHARRSAASAIPAAAAESARRHRYACGSRRHWPAPLSFGRAVPDELGTCMML